MPDSARNFARMARSEGAVAVDQREQLFWERFGRGQDTRAQAGRWKHYRWGRGQTTRVS